MSQGARTPGAPATALVGRPERDLPPVMDAAEVADWLRLASARQALDLARQRRLPSVRLGRHVLFLRDGILAALRDFEASAINDEELGAK